MSIIVQDVEDTVVECDFQVYKNSKITDTSYHIIKKELESSSGNRIEMDRFNNQLKAFKASLKNIVSSTAGHIVDGYMNYSRMNENHQISREQCEFELLSIGIVWCNFSSSAQISNKIAVSALQFLCKESEKIQWLKVAMDPIRGALTTLFLFPYVNSVACGTTSYDYESFARLSGWLEAVGEYKEESQLFSEWGRFLQEKTPQFAEECLRKAVFLGQWFEIHSRKALSAYIPMLTHSEGGKNAANDDEIDLFKSRKETEFLRKLVAA
jgi:hypothetical protein